MGKQIKLNQWREVIDFNWSCYINARESGRKSQARNFALMCADGWDAMAEHVTPELAKGLRALASHAREHSRDCVTV